MILICDYCGKKYKTYTSPRCKKHYCSKKCAGHARDTRKKIYCLVCGKSVLAPTNQNRKFCSKDCHDSFQSRNKIKLVCQTCGKTFYRSPSWTKQRKGYYCSLECRNQDPMFGKRSWVKANLIQNKKKGLNKLEKRGHDILLKTGVQDFVEQECMFNKFCVDVLIPSNKTVIQWDGNYWHGKNKKLDEVEPRVRQRMVLDKSQDAYLKKMGYTVLRFWENEIKNKEDYVIRTIARTIR